MIQHVYRLEDSTNMSILLEVINIFKAFSKWVFKHWQANSAIHIGDLKKKPKFRKAKQIFGKKGRSWKSKSYYIVVVHSLSSVQLSVTPWTAAHQASLSFTVFWSLFRVMSIESVMLSNNLILFLPLLLLPSVFLSIRVFSNELAVHIR